MNASHASPAISSALLDGEPLAAIVGESGPIPALEAGQRLVLSRFAWLRRERETVIAETSLGSGAAALPDPRTWTLALSFSSPREVDDELAQTAGLPLEAAREVAALLLGVGVLVDASRAGAEDEPPLAVWEFHDLLFHARSRLGRHGNPSGGTYRFLDRFPPAPAFPARRWPDGIALATPDYDQIERDDPPLARVQSRRRSIREYHERPITLAQLGAFLARVGRVEDYWQMPIPGPPPNSMSFAAKPYPSGGAMYELELYLAARSCEGLEAGLYHYVSDEHRLARVAGETPELERLIAQSAAGIGAAANSMQVVIVLCARLPRLAWKYQSIAYALALKHVGVVFQTMYLVATAMGLAPCAIGVGDSDLFAHASGIDYYEESAVGEFALGSSPG